jgi:hypothetical protein
MSGRHRLAGGGPLEANAGRHVVQRSMQL